jgi:hypothetical protein
MVMPPNTSPPDAVLNLQQRVTWLERQNRMLLTALVFRHRDGPVGICTDSRCQAGPVPHMAEQPDVCPILRPGDVPGA